MIDFLSASFVSKFNLIEPTPVHLKMGHLRWGQSAMKAFPFVINQSLSLRRAILLRIRHTLSLSLLTITTACVKQMSGEVIADKQKLHFQ